MKINALAFALILSFVFFSPPSFSDEGDYAQTMAESYQAAAENLENQFGDYPTDPASLEPFYAEQKRKLAEVSQQLETARQAGQMSQADYEEAQKGLAETREFIETEGKNLGPEMEKARQMAQPIITAHHACQNLQGNPQAYQACVQSKIE